MKTLMARLIILVVAVAVLSLAKDIIVKTSFEKGVEALTGLPLKTGNFRVSLVRQFVSIRRLILFNPRGYKDRIMLDAPEIYIDYNLSAIIKGKVRFDNVRINIRKFVVVKNKNGELNINSLKVVGGQEKEKKPVKKRKAKHFQIDNLELKIGKVIYKDYSKGASPLVKEFDANINERYTNITNPSSVIRLLVVKALVKTTIASLADFDLGALKGAVVDTLATAQNTVEVVATRAKKTIEETKETLQKTTEDLKNVLKLPFNIKPE
ncbi:MAG: hypothetical protein NG740_01340 [Omnitrophica bacterium]|nr:hypothetical protein [Candidatus Omnitrophota bacterium]